MATAALVILLYMIIPLWLACGFADWWCHRASDIEHTSGLRESLIHMLMFAEGGIGLLCGLFLEINAAVIAIFLALLIVHEFTGLYDLNYAYPRRRIVPWEQHVHSFLEVIPFMALALVCVLHWQQARALFMGGGDIDLMLRWKQHPLPYIYILIILVTAAFVFMAYGEELLRCACVRRVEK